MLFDFMALVVCFLCFVLGGYLTRDSVAYQYKIHNYRRVPFVVADKVDFETGEVEVNDFYGNHSYIEGEDDGLAVRFHDGDGYETNGSGAD